MTTASTKIILAAIESERAPTIARAVVRAQAGVNNVLHNLEAAGWNMDRAYPRPHGRMSRAEYTRAGDARAFAASITRNVVDRTYRLGEAYIVAPSEPLVQSYIDSVRVSIDLNFDDYAAKLAAKVGEITAAKLTGGPLWQSSILTVTRPDGSVERWKTQMILNVSSLGRLFNQWPTRKLAA